MVTARRLCKSDTKSYTIIMQWKETWKQIFIVSLILLFGTGSWGGFACIWVELPLLVQVGAPEGYALGSWVNIILQIANIVPFCVTIYSCFSTNDFRFEVPVLHVLQVFGVIAGFLLIFYWNAYSRWSVDGNLHSTGFLVLTLFICLKYNAANVLVCPYMARFKSKYINWVFVGAGLSSLIPSLVAIGQGIGDIECVQNGTTLKTNGTLIQNCTVWVQENKPARFPPSHFFLFCFVLLFLCEISFILLNILPIVRSEYISPYCNLQSASTVEQFCGYFLSSNTESEVSETIPLKDAPFGGEIPSTSDSTDEEDELHDKKSFAEYVLLCFLSAISSCFLFGALPALESYSSSAYGPHIYLVVTTSSEISIMLGSVIETVWPKDSLLVVVMTTLCGLCASAYCILTASLSPNPPLQGQPFGSFLVVLAWILHGGLFYYTIADISWILRKQPNNRLLLIWEGACYQLGTMVGAVVLFLLVNVFKLFQGHHGNWCEKYIDCTTI